MAKNETKKYTRFVGRRTRTVCHDESTEGLSDCAWRRWSDNWRGCGGGLAAAKAAADDNDDDDIAAVTVETSMTTTLLYKINVARGTCHPPRSRDKKRREVKATCTPLLLPSPRILRRVRKRCGVWKAHAAVG